MAKLRLVDDLGSDELEELELDLNKTHINARTPVDRPADLGFNAEEKVSAEEEVVEEGEASVNIQILIDDLDDGSDEENEEEEDAAAATATDEPSPDATVLATNRAVWIAALLSSSCVFEQKSSAQIADLIAEKCRLKMSQNKTRRLIVKLKQLKKYILDIQDNYKTTLIKQPAAKKIAAFENYGLKHKDKKQVTNIEQTWFKYLSEMVEFCYPGISAKKTLCNPLEFRNVIIEELIVPLGPDISEKKFWEWFGLNGEKLNRRMREKMQELVERRLKKD